VRPCERDHRHHDRRSARRRHRDEQELNLYLDQGPGKALSVSGPTKSGKTVLVERRLPRDEAIWMEGADLESVDVFWDRIVDWLGLYDLVEVTREEAAGADRQLGMTAGVPKLASIAARKTDDSRTTRGVRKTRTQAITSVAREGLETVSTPIVIDDFHYVADDAKRAVARAIKTAIPFCKVILIAVPHEAFDVVRNESDMGGRVSQMKIETWSSEELQFIAKRGFEALAIDDQHEIGKNLASNSYGAPFLMQDLCYQYATSLGVIQTSDEPIFAVEPPSWEDFFTRIANRTPPVIFEHLLKGPKTRGQKRIQRVFETGEKTDIYGSLLHAIARADKSTVSYQELALILEQDLVAPAPGGQTITLSLGQMSSIAKDHRGSGDPALAYKNDDLHVLDPFLLFYLRYGNWSVEKEINDDESDQEPLPASESA
jgi:hypothetical protein